MFRFRCAGRLGGATITAACCFFSRKVHAQSIAATREIQHHPLSAVFPSDYRSRIRPNVNAIASVLLPDPMFSHPRISHDLACPLLFSRCDASLGDLDQLDSITSFIPAARRGAGRANAPEACGDPTKNADGSRNRPNASNTNASNTNARNTNARSRLCRFPPDHRRGPSRRWRRCSGGHHEP